jgi:rhomboid protease GluP
MGHPSSVLCPSCGTLVGSRDQRCLTCGRRNPGLWGLSWLVREASDDMLLPSLVMWACGALFMASLAVDPEAVGAGSLFSFMAPSTRSLLLFGASGAGPVFVEHRWWTVLSAAWLHAGALHIVFNMLWVRELAPPVARLYGPGRATIIYCVAGVSGFGASSLTGAMPFLPPFLAGAGITVGASAPIFGLLGALLHYGRRGGSRLVGQHAKGLAATMLLFGFIMPGVDNWAHLGGLAGGYVAASLLDPLRPERGDHVIAAGLCLLLSLAAVLMSVAQGLRLFG